LNHYHAMCAFSRYFSFGTLKTNVDLSFTWYDSYSKQKVTSRNVQLEQFSALYNYAVASARLGTLMDLSGDGIKSASANLCEAASIFANLKTSCATLQPAEISPDFQS
jgi:hypothetical protein